MPDDVANSMGSVFGERLLRQLAEAPRLVFEIIERLAIDCQPMRNGTLHCAVGRQGFWEISKRAQQWQARGAAVQLLDAARAERHIGSAAYAGALLDSRAGTIQPLAYVRGLAKGAMRQGARFHVRSPVLNCEDLGSHWRINTAQGSVVAPWVIVATDAYSHDMVPNLKREQIMLPYFNLATRPLSVSARQTILPHGQGVWDTNRILSSFRLDNLGRLVFGSVGALRGSGTPVHRNWARRELTRIFPELGKVEFEYGWYGMIGMTDDALPHLHMHARNMVSISGYNGRGIAPATTFGRDLARLTTGEIGITDLALPLTSMKTTSFRTLKGAFYEVGAQVAHCFGSRFGSRYRHKQ